MANSIHPNLTSPQRFFQDPPRSDKSHGEGRMLCLLGTSTAGKTSIVQSVRKIDPSFEEGGGDLAGFEYHADQIKKEFSSEYAEMAKGLPHSEIGHLLGEVSFRKRKNMDCSLDAIKGAFAWKRNAPMAKILKVAKSVAERGEHLDKIMHAPDMGYKVHEYMLSKIFNNSASGKDIIFDIMIDDLLVGLEKNNYSAPIKIALVFCPFLKLAERVMTRNKNAIQRGDYGDIRPPLLPLIQYSEIFRKANPGDTIVETLTLKDAIEAFDTAWNGEVEIEQKRNPQRVYELYKSYSIQKEEFLVSLGFIDNSVEKVGLTPRFQRVDYLINTEELKPDESADLLTKNW